MLAGLPEALLAEIAGEKSTFRVGELDPVRLTLLADLAYHEEGGHSATFLAWNDLPGKADWLAPLLNARTVP